jgi:hypothetical protein
MPPGCDGSWEGRFDAPGRTPDGSWEALFPSEGRFTPAGSLLDGVSDGVEGTRPAPGREAPEEGSCEGLETEPVEGRETLLVDGRDALEGREVLPVEGRDVGRDVELPLDGRE